VRKGEMPPGKEVKLTVEEIALVKAWIDGGAPAAPADSPAEPAGGTIPAEDRKFWAFQKPVRPPVPRVQHAERVRTTLDALVLSKLESAGLTFAPDADRPTLLRPACFDLIGLPPSPEEAEPFRAGPRPVAQER